MRYLNDGDTYPDNEIERQKAKEAWFRMGHEDRKEGNTRQAVTCGVRVTGGLKFNLRVPAQYYYDLGYGDG